MKATPSLETFLRRTPGAESVSNYSGSAKSNRKPRAVRHSRVKSKNPDTPDVALALQQSSEKTKLAFPLPLCRHELGATVGKSLAFGNREFKLQLHDSKPEVFRPILAYLLLG
ncbi:hypothetical protein NDU88_002875 [Pleurodeles waltl]|uniref:Uncharacterized protein n=1 Tax=Pleurodeles waltl TaxID=8319 RepID=A0AAV7QD30_PLEWA|nr:hypothetical protein NDU88_002875 [Pleurodeles waltl]